jgi:hypothetical protein
MAWATHIRIFQACPDRRRPKKSEIVAIESNPAASVCRMNAVDDQRLSHIGWTLRPLVASDPLLGRYSAARSEDHHCDGL